MKPLIGLLALGLIFLPSLVACGANRGPSPQQTRALKKAPVNNVGSGTKVSTPTTGSIAAGTKLYAQACETCHGKHAMGTHRAPRLASSPTIIKRFGTQTALEAFIAHNMPASNPGSLTAEQSANAAAYVWHVAHEK